MACSISRGEDTDGGKLYKGDSMVDGSLETNRSCDDNVGSSRTTNHISPTDAPDRKLDVMSCSKAQKKTFFFGGFGISLTLVVVVIDEDGVDECVDDATLFIVGEVDMHG